MLTVNQIIQIRNYFKSLYGWLF